MNPPLEVYSKLLWREFFFVVGSQVPVAHKMVNNSLSLQIPWEDSPEYLDKWKQVSLERNTCTIIWSIPSVCIAAQ